MRDVDVALDPDDKWTNKHALHKVCNKLVHHAKTKCNSYFLFYFTETLSRSYFFEMLEDAEMSYVHYPHLPF